MIIYCCIFRHLGKEDKESQLQIIQEAGYCYSTFYSLLHIRDQFNDSL